MGLRCLLGHDFGDRRTEGEREDRGDEVVVTMRDYRECTRCGYRRILSENKEVKTKAEPPSSEPGMDPDPDERDAAKDEQLEELSAAEDDGVILEDEPAPARERGEWPEQEASEPTGQEAGPSGWPDPKGDDEGFAAEPSDGRPAEDVEFTRGGLTPEARMPDSPDDEPEESSVLNAEGIIEHEGDEVSASGTNVRRAKHGPSPSIPQRAMGADTVVVCPECDHKTPGVGSSLRSGDICPECHQGYMIERER